MEKGDCKKAIVLLSGGLDSATALYVAKSEGYNELHALTFEYGQKHRRELRAAIEIAKIAGVREHKVVQLMLDQWGHSSLIDAEKEIEDGQA